MDKTDKDRAIEKLITLPKDQVSKVLIFMAGLDAGMTLQSKSQI